MSKYILIGLILCICQVSGFTQSANELWIDSLKKKLPSLNDSAKVDGLNDLSDAFRTNGPYPAPDSIYKYAIAANKEALKIGYKKGEAFSLLNLGADKIKQAISIGESIKNPKILGRAYLDSSYKASTNNSYNEVLRKAVVYFENANDLEGELEANIRLCDAYTSNGKYEEGFKYCDKCLELKKDASLTPWGHEMVLWYFQHMADLYERAGDHETALDYCRQGNQYAAKYKLTWNLDLALINILTQLGKYDSALYYFNNFERNANEYVLKNKPYWSTSLSQIYLKSKQYDKALAISKEGITYFKNQNNKGSGLAGHLLCAANASYEIKNYKPALEYAKEGIELEEKYGLTKSVMEGYKLISDIYHQLGNNSNAYLYIQKYLLLKDSILNSQFYFRLSNYKKQTDDERKTSQINLLNKDNLLKTQKLLQEAALKKFLLAGLAGLIITGFLFFRYLSQKRRNDKLRLENEFKVHQSESEKKQAELHQRAVELEMQALRAQMNPHFIFNCLSSINRFIFKGDNKTASDYLTRFSRLIRMVLLNSSRKLITLEDELEMLRLYLDLERLRFKDAFDYSITTTNIFDAGAIFIPPLLLQPFCENAVWHGLMHKESKGHLNVIISEVTNEEEKVLHCVIEDDGVGRQKAAEMKSKSAENEKSMGLRITTERLALLNKENNFSTFYKIEDVLSENKEVSGTRVQLRIRYKESIEEYV